MWTKQRTQKHTFPAAIERGDTERAESIRPDGGSSWMRGHLFPAGVSFSVPDNTLTVSPIKDCSSAPNRSVFGPFNFSCGTKPAGTVRYAPCRRGLLGLLRITGLLQIIHMTVKTIRLDRPPLLVYEGLTVTLAKSICRRPLHTHTGLYSERVVKLFEKNPPCSFF